MLSSSAKLLTFLLMGTLITLQLQPTLCFELLNNGCSVTSSNLTSSTVKTLLKLLTSRSSLASTGFAKGSAGQAAYGLINCLPGVSGSECKACGHQAAKDALSLCPGGQDVILWYDSCLLRYSESDFLGSVETGLQFTMSSPFSVTGDPARFSSGVKDLLGKLSKKAIAGPALSAVGKTKADSSTTVYGMVGCTRDLTSADCGACLEEVVGNFGNCCEGVKGGRFITASCMFRFEIYPF